MTGAARYPATCQVSGDLLDLHQHLKPGLALRQAPVGQQGAVPGRQPSADGRSSLAADSSCGSSDSGGEGDPPVVLQVGVEQVLQAAVQAEGDEGAVEVQAERRAVLRDGWTRGHHSSTLRKPPQKLLQVCQLLRDEQASPAAETHRAQRTQEERKRSDQSSTRDLPQVPGGKLSRWIEEQQFNWFRF